MDKRAVRFLVFIILFIFIIVFIFSINVRTNAMDGQNLHRIITIVKRELETAESILMEKDSVLFEVYKNNPFSECGHQAELELMKKYPKEYNRYIEAKSYLDDLYYSRFLIIANKNY